MRQAIVSPKCPVDPPDKRGVVYFINCSDCPKSHIGETGNPLKVRLKRTHKSKAAKEGDQKSAFSQHRLETGHKVSFEEVKVEQQINYMKNRKVAKASTQKDQKP